MSVVTGREVLALIPDEGHWCKGAYTDPGGRHCLVGAAGKAGGRLSRYSLPRDITGFLGSCRRVIMEQYPERLAQIEGISSFSAIDVVIAFNDHAGTAYPDVRAVIEKVIADE
jgi:hypothetical protein